MGRDRLPAPPDLAAVHPDVAPRDQRDDSVAGVTVVCQGYHPWSPLWKRNQSLFWALATRPWAGRGVFVNRTADWKLLWQAAGAQSAVQSRAARRALVPRRIGSRHWVWTPVGPVPFGRFHVVRRVNRALHRAIASRLAGSGPRLVILNDPFADADDVESLCAGADLVALDLSDDFVAFDHGGDEARRRRTAERCAALARRADLVLAVNAHVADQYRLVNPHTFVVPNACHYEHFAGCAGRDALRSTAMREMAGRYRRIAGYYGWMMPHRLDVALLVAVIAAQPDWGFVFLGPADRAVSAELRRLPNVRLWDTVPHAALPSYVAGFDVCVLPHLVNDHTAGNDPLKLYEYLASGKPVVATPAAGVLRFREHLAVAQTADEFAAALPAALAADSPERRRARQEVARANSWAVRADQVEGILGAIGAWSRLRAS